MKQQSQKTIFQSKIIRPLSRKEGSTYMRIRSVIENKRHLAILTRLPAFVSNDNKVRPLILREFIVKKIQKDHGVITIENLIINARDWDYAIKNVDGNANKINLIKQIPDTNDLLIIGANRKNGFFIVTHYEIHARNSNKLKSLLQNRGSSLDRTGGAAVPSFATSSEESASQPDLPGVSSMI